MLTFAYCLHRILRDQTFQTDRIPLTDITVLFYELWASWPSMNVVHLRNDKSWALLCWPQLRKGHNRGYMTVSLELLTRWWRCRLSFFPCSQILSSSINSYMIFRCAGRCSHVGPSGVTICWPLLSRLLRRHRSLCRLLRRLTVLSLCIGSRYVRRVTPGYGRRSASPYPLPWALSAESTIVLCLQGRRTLVVLVLGRREEAHRLHYSLRRRMVRRLHHRLTVLSLCIGSRYVRRVTPGYGRRSASPYPLPWALSAESTIVLCLQGRRTLVVLVLGRREEAHRLHYSLRRRMVRRLHHRLTVLSLCIGSRYVRRVTPGYRRRCTSPYPLPWDISAESTVVLCLQGRRTLVVLGRREEAHRLNFSEGTSSSSPVESSQPVHR